MMNSSFTGSSADSSVSDASFRDGDSDKESISSIRSDDGDRLIWKSKQEFNRNRKIIIKNIPPVTYEEVKEFLKGCSINTISISKKSRRAIVTLLQGEDAETICESLSGSTLFDTTVIVEPYHHEHMLCISHLPSTVNHRQFKKFLTQYGAMERCFLMYESDGKCKGYGFVEYMHNREKVATVMQLLHGLPFPRLDGALSLESAGIQNSIQCHFLHDHVITYDDLQSTSLLIGQLPCTFNDESSLKELFSQQDVPCHFELFHIDEKQLVYGFAQYVSSVSAEKTWMCMNGYELSHNNGDAQNHHLDVSFCTPGQTRDDVYNNIVNSLCTKKTPPSLMSVPVLPPNLMSTLGPPPLPHTLLAPPLYPPPSLLMPPPPVVNPLRPNNPLVPSEPTVWICPVVANLLATTPHLLQSFELFLEELYYSRVNANMYGEESLNDSNVQIALLAMLLSMQIQESQPSLLQNPLIQTWSNNPQLEKTVKENINQNRPTLQGHPVLTHANSLLQDLMYSRCHTAMYHQQAARPIASAYNRRTPAAQDIATSGSDVADVPQSSPTEPEVQPVQQKETPSLKPDTSMAVDEDPAVEKAVPSLMGVSVPPVIPSLLDGMPDLSVPPPPIPETPANPALAVFFEKQILHQLKLQKDQPPVSSQSASTTNIVPLMEKSAYVVSNIRNVPSVSFGASNLEQISSDTGAATNRENPGQSSPTFSDASSVCSNVSTASNTTDGVQKCGTPHRPMQDSNKRRHIQGSHGSDVNSQLDAVEYQVDEEEDAKDNTFVTNLMQSMSKFYGEQSTSTEKPSSPPPSECMPDIFSYMDNLGVLDIQNLTSPPGIKGKSRLDSDNSDGCFTPVRSLLVTPIGQKRRGGIPHLVPSPEESPEGSYIGQHSQGLGGHYAESYLKRRRLNTADKQ